MSKMVKSADRRPDRQALVLILPAVAIFAICLAGPLFSLIDESLKPYVGGHVGGLEGAGITLQHYRDLLRPAYFLYFLDTFRIGLITTLLGILIGFPIAYTVARMRSGTWRRLIITSLIGMLFLNIIVRVYAILLTYGPLGPMKVLAHLLGMDPGSASFAEVQVILGLLHIIIPLIALTLIGTVQNISPMLEEAAQVLGATRSGALLTVTLPLAVPGLASAFVIAYAFCISNFVVPLVLGKGIVLFISNLIYIRFSEINNFPSGAAIAIVMAILSIGLVYCLMAFINRRWRTS